MEKERAKQLACEAIDKRRVQLVANGRALYAMPETGFREFRTAEFVAKKFVGLGLDVKTGVAVTGIRAKAAGRSHGRCVAIMGELDALFMPDHRHVDSITGYAHACGHHAQMAMVLSAATALVESGIMAELDGDAAFIGVPAEEAIEFGYREDLVREGRLEFTVGKQECIRLGMFEGVDAVIGGHVADIGDAPKLRYGSTYNGLINKMVRFHGRSSHAALSPELGVNALHAALNSINNINAMRSTLEDKEHPRIHYIISKGGDSVNTIPCEVTMELGVRAASLTYLKKLDERVNTALLSGAVSVGASAEIRDIGAYLPTNQDDNMCKIFCANAVEFLGAANVIDARGWHKASSTDVGEVSSILPVVYYNFSGSRGAPHTKEMDIIDENFAYADSAKAAVMTLIDLLWDGGKEIERIKAAYKPQFASREEYIAFHRRLTGH